MEDINKKLKYRLLIGNIYHVLVYGGSFFIVFLLFTSSGLISIGDDSDSDLSFIRTLY